MRLRGRPGELVGGVLKEKMITNIYPLALEITSLMNRKTF